MKYSKELISMLFLLLKTSVTTALFSVILVFGTFYFLHDTNRITSWKDFIFPFSFIGSCIFILNGYIQDDEKPKRFIYTNSGNYEIEP